MNTAKLKDSKYLSSLKEMVLSAERLRKNTSNPQDVSLAEVLATEHAGATMDTLYEDLGIDPSVDTIENLFSVAEADVRWLVPEIFRDALRLGLRKAPIYPSLVAAEETLKGLTATVPAWNMSDAAPKITGEYETIKLGEVSYGHKTIKVRKLARGIKVSYEVKKYVSLNIVSIFMQDFGVKLGMGLDTMALDALINGDQPSGTDAVSVVGVATANTLTYVDLLKVWVRLGRLGKNPNIMIGGENMAIDTLNLTEFKQRNTGTPDAKFTLKSPVPQNSSYFIHGYIPEDQVLIVDPATALIKYTAEPLLVESEKIVSNQSEATYASITCGFGTMLQDSRLVIDKSLAFSSNGFPAYMDPTTEELVIID